MVTHRSTKGASKARRDHINQEIRTLRALLPISPQDQERMSYLHSMAAVTTFIRKSVLLSPEPEPGPGPEPEPEPGPGPGPDGSSRPSPFDESFLAALHGFILVTTATAKLVYVSENVSEFLGFSMLDVLQGDSLYDMLERSDVDAVKSKLEDEKNSSTERSFVCRMQTSKSFKLQRGAGCSVLVRGRFLPSSSSSSSSSSCDGERLFVSLCTPTVDRLQSADALGVVSEHRLDMSFTQVHQSSEFFWGFSADELFGRSWYSLIHPEDLCVCADAHRSLVQADAGSQVELVFRLQVKGQTWTWVYTRAKKLPELQGVSCTSFTISETEAVFLRTKVSGEAFKAPRFPAQQTPQTQSSSAAKCLKRRRTSESEEQSARARSDITASSPELFTPPYSPASSSCSLPQEPLGRDLLLACHLSPSFIASPPPSSSSSPSFDFQTPPPDLRLVPDLLSDLYETSHDCALHHDDLLQPPPGGVLLPQHHALPPPSALLTPSPSPAATARESDYSEQEQAEISILAQQISSLASSFSSYQSALRPPHANATAACDWTLPPPLKRERVLDDGVFESILKDLDMVSRSESQQLQEDELLAASFGGGGGGGLQVAPLPAEAFLDPFGLQLGRSDNNHELHQLNEYMQRVFQQDALTEENLY